MLWCLHAIKDKYDEKSARAHIKKLSEILSTPPVLSTQNDIEKPKKVEEKPKEKETDKKDEEGSTNV